MVQNLIERAELNLKEVSDNVAQGNFEKAIGFALWVKSFLEKAAQLELSREVERLIEFLHLGKSENAIPIIKDLHLKLARLLLEELEEIKKEKPHIRLIRLIICHKCNKYIPIDSKFCSYCGTQFRRTKCINCGKPITSEMIFCVYCGRKLKLSR